MDSMLSSTVWMKHALPCGYSYCVAARSARLVSRLLRFARASSLAPFSYTQIVSATLIGLLVFGDFPDRWTITGAAILCLSGIFIAFRERQRARRQT